MLSIVLSIYATWLVSVSTQAAAVGQHLWFNSQAVLHSDSSHDLSEFAGFAVEPQTDLKPSMTLKAKSTTVYRPRSLEAFHRARLRSLRESESEIMEWDRREVLGPDVEDRHTLVQLARMSGNAYALPGQKNWYEVDPAWNTVSYVYLQK